MILPSSLGGWCTVANPSAQAAISAAVSGERAAANMGGGSSGRVHSFARSTRTRPS